MKQFIANAGQKAVDVLSNPKNSILICGGLTIGLIIVNAQSLYFKNEAEEAYAELDDMAYNFMIDAAYSTGYEDGRKHPVCNCKNVKNGSSIYIKEV